jgi:hypothetical protein
LQESIASIVAKEVFKCYFYMFNQKGGARNHLKKRTFPQGKTGAELKSLMSKKPKK